MDDDTLQAGSSQLNPNEYSLIGDFSEKYGVSRNEIMLELVRQDCILHANQILRHAVHHSHEENWIDAITESMQKVLNP